MIEKLNIVNYQNIFRGTLPFLAQGNSTMETLALLQKKLNEIIDQFNSEDDKYFGYTDEQVALLREEVEQALLDLEGVLRQVISSGNEQIAQDILTQYIKITSETDTKIVELRNLLFEMTAELNTYIDEEVANIYKYVNEQFVYLRIVNPITGEVGTVQQAIDSLADLHKEQSITAQAYDNKNLSASVYDSKNLTAYLYDFFATQYLN